MKLSFLAVSIYALYTLQASAVYNADATTGGNIRFYLEAAELTPAPVGTAVWFVADTNNNGIDGLVAFTLSSTALQAINDGTGSDKLFFSDIVDGAILGTNPGKYTRTITNIPDAFSTANIYVFLFNDGTPLSGTETFGLLNLGVIPAPGVGNAAYNINTNVHADQNIVLPIPEPTTAALIFIGVTALALRRRTLAA